MPAVAWLALCAGGLLAQALELSRCGVSVLAPAAQLVQNAVAYQTSSAQRTRARSARRLARGEGPKPARLKQPQTIVLAVQGAQLVRGAQPVCEPR